MISNLNKLSLVEQQQLKRILDVAHDLFLSNGVKTMRMEDLATELSVSKKTIYRYISNKAELVEYCVQNQIDETKQIIVKIGEDSKDAIEEILLIGKTVIESLSRFNSNAIIELKKFYPASWQLVEQHHSKFVINNIKKNLLRGIEESLYRPDINVDIVASIYIGMSQLLLEVNEFDGKNYVPSDVYIEFFRYHIRGIASTKGVKKLANYNNKIKLNI